jgi:hypothetical protein
VRNTLDPNDPRVGFCWGDGVEDFAATVVNTGDAIELIAAFEERDENFRMFVGRSASFGDDPDYTNFRYDLPKHLWFADSRGVLCLINPFNRSASLMGVQEGRARFRFAVHTDGLNDRSYERVHSLRTRLEGLEEWMPLGSLEYESVEHADGRSDRITFKRREPVRFASALNASLRPSYDYLVSAAPGQSKINDQVFVETRVRQPRPWEEHLRLHRAMRDLLVVAGWRPYGTWDVRVGRMESRQRADGTHVEELNWSPVTTFDLVTEAGAVQHEPFLFTYEDLGPRRLRRWLPLRERYRRGIAGMIHSVGVPGVALETMFSEAGAALEYIGFAIAVEMGEQPGQKLRTHLRRIAAEINADLQFDVDDWVLQFADLYRGVKHADRPDAGSLELLNTLRQARLVFRTWVATRLGITDDVIERSLPILPMTRPYRRL